MTSTLIIVLFIIIFLCSLPFNFHALKVCTLNFIEEIRVKKISTELEKNNGNFCWWVEHTLKLSEKDGIIEKLAIEDTVSTC